MNLRVLNRTLLRRQFLLERTSLPALDVVSHLVAMQAQEPNWPFVGLWTRVAGFRHADLTAPLEDGRVVRCPGLRATQHLVAGTDYRWLRATMEPIFERYARSAYVRPHTDGIEPETLVAAAREILGDQPIPRRELARRLAERFPGRKGAILAQAAELRLPLVQPGVGWGGWWSRSGIPVVLADAWLGDLPARTASIEHLLERYLAAFGPASVKDLQEWSGLTRLREPVERMRPRLRTHRSETGAELFDLPDAPIADADEPAPVRFLPGYDNAVLGHADRTRILSDGDRKRVMPGYSLIHPTFLVDGFVRGIWSVTGATLAISPFRPLSPTECDEVLAEAHALLPFLTDGAGGDVVMR